MKVVEVKNKRVAQRLIKRLLKKGLVVAEVNSLEETKKGMIKRANVVIVSADDND